MLRSPTRLTLTHLEPRETPAVAFTAFGAAEGLRPLVEVFRPDGTSLVRFEAFEPTFRGGVRAAAAELDGDARTLEVIAGAGPGGGPAVHLFRVDLNTTQVAPLGAFFAFDPAFTGGVRVAAGNITGPDSRQEIIVGADAGGGPHVRAFRFEAGRILPADGPLADFFAFEPSFRGGVRIASGELDGNLLDGDELVVAAGPTGGPRVRVFRSDGAVIGDYFAFRSDYRGGVHVTVTPTGTLGGIARVTVDALPDDPSQRNAELNVAAQVGIEGAVAARSGVPSASVAGFAAPSTTATPTGFSVASPGLSAAGFGINPFANNPAIVGGSGTTFGTSVTGGTVNRNVTGVGTTVLGNTVAGFVGTSGTTPAGSPLVLSEFGDPGLQTPFPVLVGPPFTGLPIGVTTFVATL